MPLISPVRRFAADCCFTLRLLFLDYQSAILEMQREEANQRLRELEEGENYFIILPDSRRRIGVCVSGAHISLNIYFRVPQRADKFDECD